MSGGYSGRTLDTAVVTPFLRKVGFPYMQESGWLTRSLEQSQPYNQNYLGEIKPTSLKSAFLNILETIQEKPELAEEFLQQIFTELELLRRKKASRPITKLDDTIIKRLTVSDIVQLLALHFSHSYSKTTTGGARLPVLAFYAIYRCLIAEVTRFQNKTLLPLESHTSADIKSGRLGDIDVVTTVHEELQPFEAVEIKLGISISLKIVEIAYEKIKNSPVQRYYILSTNDIKAEEKAAIQLLITKVKSEHGCEIITNGVIPSLKYYLRLLDNIENFLDYYAESLQNDNVVKEEHRTKWNELLENIAKLTSLPE